MVQEIQAWATVIANIVMALAAVGALQQVSLLKKDIRDRNKRAANEKALESVAEYARFAELSEKFSEALKKASLPTYHGPVSDFTPNSVPEEWRDNEGAERYKVTDWIAAINQLDKLAATLVTGVGSERTAFSIIGRSYCGNVAHYYDIISRLRINSGQPHLVSIVELYRLWSPRLSDGDARKRKNFNDSAASWALTEHEGKDMAGQSFDSAALAGATLAATLSVLGTPGPFKYESAIIGLTLLVILVSYEGGRRRTILQSIAVSMATALAALLPVGTLLELYYGHGSLAGIPQGEGAETSIKNADIVMPLCWLILFAVALLSEGIMQRVLRKADA